MDFIFTSISALFAFSRNWEINDKAAIEGKHEEDLRGVRKKCNQPRLLSIDEDSINRQGAPHSVGFNRTFACQFSSCNFKGYSQGSSPLFVIAIYYCQNSHGSLTISRIIYSSLNPRRCHRRRASRIRLNLRHDAEVAHTDDST
ncbi:hypothetical protein KM043_011727 [Ampulex compressa]|nr:hypothetical protein KM043_011727 [Ampulex compressa]